MPKDFEKFFYKVGLLIPGFKGYKTKEDLRESDYKIRLFAQSSLQIFIDKIEKLKRNLNDDNLIKIDFLQKELKIASVKVINQEFGYRSFFSGESTEETTKILEQVMRHDESLIDLIDDMNSHDEINVKSLEEFNEKLNSLLEKRGILLA